MNRDEELTLRLTNLIESLAEETGVAEPPLEAAASWTEAAVRAYFRSGGTVTPAAACKDSGDVIPGQPGGGRVASSESNGAKDTVPQHIEIARMNASAESYRVAAFAAGIPDRPWGLFPPNDPVLRGIAEEPGSFKPLQKNIIGLSGGFEVVQKSWILSEGLDMRRAPVFRYGFCSCPAPFSVVGVVRHLVAGLPSSSCLRSDGDSCASSIATDAAGISTRAPVRTA